MRAWDEPAQRRRSRAPGDEAGEAVLHELEARGIDLDPAAPGEATDSRLLEAEGHHHPHLRSGPGEPPTVGIVGAGAVGTTLGVALARADWPVRAVASRDPGRRERFRVLVPGARAFAEANALLDEVELVILAVPDDALPALAGTLRLYSGQAIVHTSGALGAEVLAPAMAAGTRLGAFHPLVSFADVERGVAALHGATVAIEGDDELLGLLADMAEAVGATPVRLSPGTKAAYHAAAVLAAGGFVALLDAIVELGRAAGLDEPGAVAIYGRLVEQTLGNARALGVAASLTGPMVRGDVGTLRRHLDALAMHAPAALPLYRAAAERELAIAEGRGALAPEVVAAMRACLARTG